MMLPAPQPQSSRRVFLGQVWNEEVCADSASRQPSSPLTTVRAPDAYQVHHHYFFRLAVQLTTTVMGEGGVSMAVLMRNRSPSLLGT